MRKKINIRKESLWLWFFIFIFQSAIAQDSIQHSVARQWNEVLLEAIRSDFARPTVHARNLFHASIALYDSWSIYDQTASPFLLGKIVGGYNCPCEGVTPPENIKAAREEAMSYAVYRLLVHRFKNAPGKSRSLPLFDELMDTLGYDITFSSLDHTSGSPAALGNYLANCLIEFGLQDGSNEADDYSNQYYEPVNQPLIPGGPGSGVIANPDRWQPLLFVTAEDQAGFELDRTPKFVSPEWGQVVPFSLNEFDLNIYSRNGDQYWVYHDPGDPVYLSANSGATKSDYQWGHSLVSIWSSHLDPSDGVMWDISPASIGNIADYPTSVEGLRNFYDRYEGGDPSRGHALNPKTGEPYSPQIVPRGDYARVLAEFWADGPDSETPPGHWFTILNTVSDHHDLVKKFKGEGALLTDLEWDVKAYFVLGGAMHDAAITAWGIKGWYDYIRPISAIRYMAQQGQSTDQVLSNYSPKGLPLEEGFIEIVNPGDPLAGENNEHIGKIKLYAWNGTKAVDNPRTDVAGVGWILAENWVPYQRPTFVTPPFAGYVSGHSTFSRAAAEVMTLFTGDEYFPGGVGEFEAKKNEFLVFEEGPSMDVVLQWATYRDASDQTSLSRIWGGIHPPVDDIPGRLIGIEVGKDAFAYAETYFGSATTSSKDLRDKEKDILVYPNPVFSDFLTIKLEGNTKGNINLKLYSIDGKLIIEENFPPARILNLDVGSIPTGIYLLNLSEEGKPYISQQVVLK